MKMFATFPKLWMPLWILLAAHPAAISLSAQDTCLMGMGRNGKSSSNMSNQLP